jgi:hypothetical protein
MLHISILFVNIAHTFACALGCVRACRSRRTTGAAARRACNCHVSFAGAIAFACTSNTARIPCSTPRTASTRVSSIPAAFHAAQLGLLSTQVAPDGARLGENVGAAVGICTIADKQPIERYGRHRTKPRRRHSDWAHLGRLSGRRLRGLSGRRLRGLSSRCQRANDALSNATAFVLQGEQRILLQGERGKWGRTSVGEAVGEAVGS